jgi:hypothetical protein
MSVSAAVTATDSSCAAAHRSIRCTSTHKALRAGSVLSRDSERCESRQPMPQSSDADPATLRMFAAIRFARCRGTIPVPLARVRSRHTQSQHSDSRQRKSNLRIDDRVACCVDKLSHGSWQRDRAASIQDGPSHEFGDR